MNLSFWEKETYYKSYDLCIIGAGIVGSTLAYFIKETQPNLSICIIERGSIPNGASTKNAGFACFGSMSEILEDAQHLSEKQLTHLLQLRYQGLQLLQKIIPSSLMDYQQLGGYEIFNSHQKETIDGCFSHIGYINKIIQETLNIKECFKTINNNWFPNAHGQLIFNQYEGQLNPAKMIQYLHSILHQKGVKFLWNHEINHHAKEQNIIHINGKGFSLKTKLLAYCTNAFSPSYLNQNIIPARNQVLVSKPISNLPWKGTFHYDKGYVYFRNIGNRILLGGMRNIDLQKEETTEIGRNQLIIDSLLKFAKEHFMLSDLNFEHHWSGIITSDKSKKAIVKCVEDQVYLGARLGGMGVAIGSKIGKQLSAVIQQDPILNRF